jgi:hypothetical protein
MDRPADAAAFAKKWPVKFLDKLPYDPLAAKGLDVIAASHLGISDAERAVLARDGFVVSERQTFPSFFYGYKAIYADHLPLYVSADSVLAAVHRSYDKILSTMETTSLSPQLLALLTEMRDALEAGGGADLPASTRADVDLYLAVALSLLGAPSAPVAGADAQLVGMLVAEAVAATGTDTVPLFGEARMVDFSQFKPRGHYTQSTALMQYFRAMMWLGRTDFRFVTYDPNDTSAPPAFHRREFLDSLLLAELAQGAPLGTWTQIDSVLRGFVGESDNMVLPDFTRLESAEHLTSLAALATLSDAELGTQILGGDFGIQRIASQLILVPPEGANVPLDRVFLLFGQRFVIDAEVLADVVFDRVMGDPQRLMPNPLDVAFAALGNSAAGPQLASDLAKYPHYAGALSDMRTLVDEHQDDFWNGSLYGTWLSALRGFSAPSGDATAVVGLPSLMQTEPWSRRVLSTELASWAQLRHDTLLYAKQSYTAGIACDFPDAFVDPYPDAWAGIVRLAQLGQSLARTLPTTVPGVGAYFATLESAASTLRDMASAELAGQPFTAAQMAFIQETVSETLQRVGCTEVSTPMGWYPSLFYDQKDVEPFDPTIADVHTDPNTMQVLHVGTGAPRYMLVTADTCTGVRAYAGLASAYYEQTEANFQRLDDATWAGLLMQKQPPADVPWISDLVAQ